MTKEKFLRECIEYRILRKELIMWIIMLAFIEILVAPIAIEEGLEFIIISLVFLIFLMPFILYYIIKIRKIKKYFKDYVYYEVVLDKVNNSILRSRVYFTVTIIHDQKNYKLDTKSIFSTAVLDFIFEPLDTYMNKKVLIAFNPKLEQIVVVKKI